MEIFLTLSGMLLDHVSGWVIFACMICMADKYSNLGSERCGIWTVLSIGVVFGVFITNVARYLMTILGG